MSTRRRDRSRSREKSRERSPRARLRMDTYMSRNGRSKATPPRSREIDNVMKRARRSDSQSTYWNKKLLEVEEKDPNRWRHSGYKELYHRTGSSKSNSDSVSRSRSRSKSQSNSTSRSFARVGSPRRGGLGGGIGGRARSPQRDLGGRARSPLLGSRGRSPRIRSPRSPDRTRERSPRRDTGGHSIQRDSSLNRRGKAIRARSPRGERMRSRSPRSMRKPRSPGPRSPPPKKVARANRSKSFSSETSSSCCSNESCSVCSPPHKAGSKEREIPIKEKPREVVPKLREVKKEPIAGRPRPMPRTPPERSRSRSFSVPRSKPVDKKKKKKEKAFKLGRPPFIKVESDSESSSGRGSTVGIVSSISGPKLSLSERFGRMAQWSTDRDLEHRNLRITAGDRLTVEMDSPPSPLYPPSLSSLAELGSWDDVRVRYTYYKERGYLKDLTLQDYIKWEQWWYKYQDWLESDWSSSYYRRRI